MRIALASSNGDAVDLHLGKAVSLAIYDVVDDKFDFVETRKVVLIRMLNIRVEMLFKNAVTVML